MKKIYTLLTLLMMSIASLSAQENTSGEDTKWGVGVRLGGGLELMGRYDGFGEVAGKPMYLEARLGVNMPFFLPQGTVIAAWDLLQFGESKVGAFTFDVGVAANAGGSSPKAWWVGVGPAAKLDYTFSKVPITLALDYTPIACALSFGFTTPRSASPQYFPAGLWNAAISCSYNF